MVALDDLVNDADIAVALRRRLLTGKRAVACGTSPRPVVISTLSHLPQYCVLLWFLLLLLSCFLAHSFSMAVGRTRRPRLASTSCSLCSLTRLHSGNDARRCYCCRAPCTAR